MRLKTYFKGLGLGIFVTTLVLSLVSGNKQQELSDAEIIKRAEALGMVSENSMLLSEAQTLADNAQKQAMDKQSENETSKDMTPADSSTSANTVSPAMVVSDPSIDDSAMIKTEEKEDRAAGTGVASVSEGETSETTVSSDLTEKAGKEAAEKELAASKAATEKAAAEKAASEKAASEKAASEKAASEKAAAEKAASEKAASEKAASEKAASEKAASEKAASEKAASEKAASEKAASEKAASEKAASESAKTSGNSDTSGNSSEVIVITVNSGEGSVTVANKMKQAGLISDASQFDAYLVLAGYDRKLVVGAHPIPVDATPEEIGAILTSKQM